MPKTRAGWGPLAIAIACLGLAGCPRVTPPPVEDAGIVVEPDGGTPPVRVDSDGDGLCDQTELERGTVTDDPDSDDDGFGDGIERQMGWLPLDPTSPDRDLLVFLTESERAAAQLPILRAVRGEGQTFSGAFSAVGVVDRLDLDARAFFDRALAVGAVPAENVFEVREEDQQFVGVVGRTQLTFEVRFAFGENLPRSCGRVYPFRYEVRRDDGVTVLFSAYTLVILPVGARLDTTAWCVPEGGCI